MIEIKNRHTGEVLHTVPGETLSEAYLRGADLTSANLANANLSGANLTRADLRGADLTGASLYGANLTAAALAGADLTGAQLPEGVPTLPGLAGAILARVEADPGALDMGTWHRCETTHCLAGWAAHLAGEAGYALEGRFGPAVAGALIFAASGHPLVPDFYASDEDALASLRELAAKERVA